MHFWLHSYVGSTSAFATSLKPESFSFRRLLLVVFFSKLGIQQLHLSYRKWNIVKAYDSATLSL